MFFFKKSVSLGKSPDINYASAYTEPNVFSNQKQSGPVYPVFSVLGSCLLSTEF